MNFKANANHNYFIIWPAPPLTRNSAPTGCRATTSWFSKTLFVKLMVWLGWSWKPCVSKPLYCTTGISGNISYPLHIPPLNGGAALACSAAAGALRHILEWPREKVCFQPVLLEMTPLYPSFAMLSPSPTSHISLRDDRSGGKPQYCTAYAWEWELIYERMRGGSWLCKTCTKCMSLGYLHSSLWACLHLSTFILSWTIMVFGVVVKKKFLGVSPSLEVPWLRLLLLRKSLQPFLWSRAEPCSLNL